MNKTLLTIGHSNHGLNDFMNLLSTNKIELVIDVRSAPYSKIYPHFNRESLESSLTKNSIKYLFLGDSVGGRSNSIDDYSNGRVVYKKLAEKKEYISSINLIISLSSQHKAVLMCSEKEPLECHRTLLISRSIEASKVKVLHIHRNGKIESHEEAIERLLRIWNLDSPSLFGKDIERIDEALFKQESKYAFFNANMIV